MEYSRIVLQVQNGSWPDLIDPTSTAGPADCTEDQLKAILKEDSCQKRLTGLKKKVSLYWPKKVGNDHKTAGRHLMTMSYTQHLEVWMAYKLTEHKTIEQGT